MSHDNSDAFSNDVELDEFAEEENSRYLSNSGSDNEAEEDDEEPHMEDLVVVDEINNEMDSEPYGKSCLNSQASEEDKDATQPPSSNASQRESISYEEWNRWRQLEKSKKQPDFSPPKHESNVCHAKYRNEKFHQRSNDPGRSTKFRKAPYIRKFDRNAVSHSRNWKERISVKPFAPRGNVPISKEQPYKSSDSNIHHHYNNTSFSRHRTVNRSALYESRPKRMDYYGWLKHKTIKTSADNSNKGKLALPKSESKTVALKRSHSNGYHHKTKDFVQPVHHSKRLDPGHNNNGRSSAANQLPYTKSSTPRFSGSSKVINGKLVKVHVDSINYTSPSTSKHTRRSHESSGEMKVDTNYDDGYLPRYEENYKRRDIQRERPCLKDYSVYH